MSHTALKALAPTLLFVLLAFPEPSLGIEEPTDAQDPEWLPTPYTAEQIRDTWTRGFWIITRTRTRGSVTTSRTVVKAWSEDGSEVLQQEIKANGQFGDPGPRIKTTWAQLRDHARFPAETAERERASRTTALGTYDGWLYRVRVTESDGSETLQEFFFADDFPGSPIHFRALRGNTEVLSSEQLRRRDAS